MMNSFKRALLLTAAVTPVMVLPIGTAAYAQAAPRTYSIPAQNLGTALQQLATQSGRDVVFDPTLTAGKKSKAVHGTGDAEQALRMMLAGSGLAYTTTSQGFAVRSAVGNAPAAAETPASKGEGTAAGATAGNGSAESGAIAEILVMGRRNLNADIRRSPDAIQPYVVFDSRDIGRSGAQNISDFLAQRLTSSSAPNLVSGESTGVGAVGARSNIALRGLSSLQTLILIDGRRQGQISFNGSAAGPDITAIPLDAIDRVEVLPTSAAGIYGGSAVGGVINIILKRDYSGAGARLTYGNTFRSDSFNRRVDLTAGFGFFGGRSHLMISGSLADGSTLLSGDRDFAEQARSLQLQNNPSAIFSAATPPLGATTNVRSTTGANLTLKPAYGGAVLGSPFTTVPYGYAGPASDNGAALKSAAGTYNLDLPDTAQTFGLRQSLVAPPTLKSIDVSLKTRVTDWLDSFVEFAAQKNSVTYPNNSANTTFTLAASAPANPFNQPIRVTTPAFGADTSFGGTIENYKGLAGLIFSLPFKWRGEADFSASLNKASTNNPRGISAAAAADVSSGVLNIFRDTNAFPLDFSGYLTAPTSSSPDFRDHYTDGSLRLSGPMPLRLPGGDVTATVLLESRRDVLDSGLIDVSGVPALLVPRQTQRVDSAYGELLAPIVSSMNAKPGLRLLELQLSARTDRYVSVGSAVVSVDANLNPKTPVVFAKNRFSSTNGVLGFRYKPVDDLMLRASYSTGFLPPSINSFVARTSIVTAATAAGQALRDPLRGNEIIGASTGYSLIAGGNPNLLPENSKSQSIGIVLTPSILRGLRLSADWTRIKKTNGVTALALTQDAINQFAQFAPDRLIRSTDPATRGSFSVGPITALDFTSLNAAHQDIEALDLALDYSVAPRDIGRFTVAGSATHLIRNRLQLSALAPVQDEVGVPSIGGGLRWQANFSVQWDRGPWSAGWNIRYYSSYFENVAHSIDPNLGSARVPSQSYQDLFLQYKIKDASVLFLNGMEVQIGATNFLDHKPPADFALFSSGIFFSTYADARLASYYVTFRKHF